MLGIAKSPFTYSDHNDWFAVAEIRFIGLIMRLITTPTPSTTVERLCCSRQFSLFSRRNPGNFASEWYTWATKTSLCSCACFGFCLFLTLTSYGNDPQRSRPHRSDVGIALRYIVNESYQDSACMNIWLLVAYLWDTSSLGRGSPFARDTLH